MADALKANVRFECGPNVERGRQRIYRTRRQCQARGDFRFDMIKVEVDGSTLVIGRRARPTLAQRRHSLHVLRQLHALAVEWGVRLPEKSKATARDVPDKSLEGRDLQITMPDEVDR